MLKVRIFGGGREVGRAAVGLQHDDKRFLLMDYGVNFDENDKPRLPEHVRPTNVAGLILTHAHLDHVGAAPLLGITGRVPVVTTSLTKRLSELMIRDFIKISGYYLPYEEADLINMLENTYEYSYGAEANV
ncbi:MAG: MBL fold metallo-hydrolase, partial [Zestosphaera sp.]